MSRDSYQWRIVSLATALCILVCLTQSALSQSSYHADVSVAVTMGALPLGTGAAVIPGPTSLGAGGFGNFVAIGAADATPFAFGLNTSALAEGFAAAAPPPSFATSFGSAKGTIELLNTNPFAVVFPFDIAWDWTISATTGGPDDFAYAAISYAVSLDGALLKGGAASVRLIGGPAAAGASQADTLGVLALLRPGLHIIDIDPVASGTAATPEPSLLLLFGTGTLGLFGYAWRRRREA